MTCKGQGCFMLRIHYAFILCTAAITLFYFFPTVSNEFLLYELAYIAQCLLKRYTDMIESIRYVVVQY